MPSRAVLFDFDGVIADTENVHIAAWERTFAAMAWDVPPEVCARAAEEDDVAFLAEVFASMAIDDGDISGWVARKQAITLEMLLAFPRVYRGVPELVARLAGRATLAVVSGTWRENVTAVLKAAGLEKAFATIVAKEDIASPKPDPEPYHLALKRLRISPASAVALEDSPRGVRSARSAGVRVIAVGHRHEPGAWAEGADYVDDLTDTDRMAKFCLIGSTG